MVAGAVPDSGTCQLIGQETSAEPSGWIPAARHTRSRVGIGLEYVAVGSD